MGGVCLGTSTVILLSPTAGRSAGLGVKDTRESLEEDNSPSASSPVYVSYGVVVRYNKIESKSNACQGVTTVDDHRALPHRYCSRRTRHQDLGERTCGLELIQWIPKSSVTHRDTAMFSLNELVEVVLVFKTDQVVVGVFVF